LLPVATSLICQCKNEFFTDSHASCWLKFSQPSNNFAKKNSIATGGIWQFTGQNYPKEVFGSFQAPVNYGRKWHKFFACEVLFDKEI